MEFSGNVDNRLKKKMPKGFDQKATDYCVMLMSCNPVIFIFILYVMLPFLLTRVHESASCLSFHHSCLHTGVLIIEPHRSLITVTENQTRERLLRSARRNKQRIQGRT